MRVPKPIAGARELIEAIRGNGNATREAIRNSGSALANSLRPFVAIPAALTLTTCVAGATALNPIRTVTPFDPSLAAHIMELGANTITGQAFLRQRGGGVVTCAGATVDLFPQTPYSRERVLNLYGTITQPSQGTRFLDDPDPRYLELTRETICDADGNFRFADVPDGEYFVIARVQWEVASSTQGGPVMAPAAVSGGEEVHVLIAP